MEKSSSKQMDPRGCTINWRIGHFAVLGVALLGWLLLGGMNVWHGELNQDEGWYLYAAGQLSEGRVPYRDFAFTQAPMLPVVYAAVYNWVRHFGVLGGRSVTWLFGALATAGAVWMAMRLGPKSARRMTGGICFILVGLNIYQSYFFSIVKTYSLSALFLISGLAVLLQVSRRRAFGYAFAAGFLLACAAATRMSLGVALACGGVWLLIFARHVKRWAWLDYGLGGLLGLALFCLPFYALGRDGFVFGVFEYHMLRESGTLMSQLAYKAGCIIRLVQAYFPAVLLALALFLLRSWQRCRCRPVTDGGRERLAAAVASQTDESGFPFPLLFLWMALGALVLVHLSAPFPYDDYQVPVYPLFCILLAVTVSRVWMGVEERYFSADAADVRGVRRVLVLTVMLILCGAYVLTSPMLQSWFVAGRDRIWWRLRDKSPMAQLQETAAWVAELTRAAGGTVLLTQDTYLAVEAGLPVPPGLEMGPFSYYPEWSSDRAASVHVMNRPHMLELLATTTNAPIIAMSGYGWTIRSPEVEEVVPQDAAAFRAIIESRFEHVETIPHFGQAATPLELWRLKAVDEDAAAAPQEPPIE